MKRLFLLGLLATLAATTVPVAMATSAYGKFLPPDQAFQLQARTMPNAILLDWRIADGYYLYRKKFKIVATHGTVGKAYFPPGETKNDPNFGRSEVYRREVRVTLPYKQIPADGRVALTVTYQGCADAGLCYPPITKHLNIMVTPPAKQATGGGSTASGGAGGGPVAGSGSAQSAQGHLANLVEHANPFWFFVVFFALGVLLAFTPCVLPMVPILAGILGKDRSGSARRGFALSLVYVLAMAVVYTAAGVAAGFVGTGLQGFFQTSWIIALFAAIFVVLALSLFGLYELRLPAAITNRLSAASGRTNGASWAGAAGMGALAALIVSPCIAAPIAGALVVIGQAGEPTRGGIALAALALGMGAPLVVYGTVAGRLLPKAGRWMTLIERLLGIAMLAYAAWLLGRILPAPVILVLWGAIGLLAALVLGVFKRPMLVRDHGLTRGAGVVAGLAGLVLIAGGVAGGTNPLAPFAGLRAMPQAEAMALPYTPVQSVAALKTQLAQASAVGRPVMVAFSADWCTSCLEMDHKTLHNPAVRRALARMTLLKVDVTDNTPAERQLLKHFGLYGPPAYLFFDRCGRRLNAQEVVGFT
ncbi:MAG: protein-disulfide reductase DsbD, partial [Gammaproteobacteria bacterium]